MEVSYEYIMLMYCRFLYLLSLFYLLEYDYGVTELKFCRRGIRNHILKIMMSFILSGNLG